MNGTWVVSYNGMFVYSRMVVNGLLSSYEHMYMRTTRRCIYKLHSKPAIGHGEHNCTTNGMCTLLHKSITNTLVTIEVEALA